MLKAPIKPLSGSVTVNSSTNNSNSGLNDSEVSSVIIGEEDIQDMIKELDIEAIRKEVFGLYEIKYGLDT